MGFTNLNSVISLLILNEQGWEDTDEVNVTSFTNPEYIQRMTIAMLPAGELSWCQFIFSLFQNVFALGLLLLSIND